MKCQTLFSGGKKNKKTIISLLSESTWRVVKVKGHFRIFILSLSFSDSFMFVPTFVELDSTDIDENRKKLLDANVQYPFGE